MRILVVTANEDNQYSAECSLADHDLTIIDTYQAAWSMFQSGRGRAFELVMLDYAIGKPKSERRQVFAQLIQTAVLGGVTKLIAVTQSRKALIPAGHSIATLCEACSCETCDMYLIVFENAMLSFMYAGRPYLGLQGINWERMLEEFEPQLTLWREVYE